MSNETLRTPAISDSGGGDSSQLEQRVSQLEAELAHWRGLAEQAEEQRRLALEFGRLGTWIWDIPNDHVTRDGCHEELFGFAPGTFSGTYEGFLSCLHPDDREPVKREIARCIATHESYRQEYRVVWPDGSLHWIEGRARFHFDEKGEPVRMIGIIQEITERKLVEEQQARFRALFEAAQDAVLIADDQRRYVDANPAAGELFGLKPDELRGRRIEEFVEDVRGGGVDEAWRSFRSTGVQRGECRLRRADGTLLEVEYSATRSFAPGLHLSILRDVTARKRDDEAFARQAAELTRSNADLQQFAYATSHDLQEPLRAMSSFSQLLAKRYRGQLDAEADLFLEYIISGAMRMRGVIDSLLVYARVANIDVLPPVAVALETPLLSAVMNLQSALEETRGSVTHERLPRVVADSVQLTQLFQNLVGNAIKYRKAEEPPRIHVSAQERESDYVISVKDNGVGVDPIHAEDIFGVFKRLHGANIPGAGIGLAICKRIVENHGGRIWVESTPGLGATFVFTIPRRDQIS